MASPSTAQIPLDPSVTAQLACPECHGELRSAASKLVCAGCGRAYPVIDGIPVLIGDCAEPGGVA